MAEDRTPITITIEQPLSCLVVVDLFYDGYLTSTEADRLIKMSGDPQEAQDAADRAISDYYGP